MRDQVLRKSRVLAGRLEHTAEVCNDIPPQGVKCCGKRLGLYSGGVCKAAWPVSQERNDPTLPEL